MTYNHTIIPAQFNRQCYSLNGNEVLSIVNDLCNVVKYGDIENYYVIEDLFLARGEQCRKCIILYETAPNYGHWIGIHWNSDKNIISFLDPYGKAIDTQLDHISNKFKLVSNQDESHLSKLLINYRAGEIEYCNVKLQSSRRLVNTCGRWIGLYLRLSDSSSLEQFENYFVNESKKTGKTKDYIVTNITSKIIYNFYMRKQFVNNYMKSLD